MPHYWTSPVKEKDDFGDIIDDIIIDGKTKSGPWAIMTPKSFEQNGLGLGTGLGQKYQKQKNDLWLKIEG